MLLVDLSTNHEVMGMTAYILLIPVSFSITRGKATSLKSLIGPLFTFRRRSLYGAVLSYHSNDVGKFDASASSTGRSSSCASTTVLLASDHIFPTIISSWNFISRLQYCYTQPLDRIPAYVTSKQCGRREWLAWRQVGKRTAR